MSVLMRIVQQYDIRREKQWMDLEKKFAALEKRRPDFPKGRRLQPISGPYACNTLIWECEFPSLDAARKALSFFAGDSAHEVLLEQSLPLFEQVRIEFYDVLEM